MNNDCNKLDLIKMVDGCFCVFYIPLEQWKVLWFSQVNKNLYCETTILHAERSILQTETITFTSTKFKGTFQAFFHPYFGDFEFFGGWILDPKDLKGPSGQLYTHRYIRLFFLRIMITLLGHSFEIRERLMKT